MVSPIDAEQARWARRGRHLLSRLTLVPRLHADALRKGERRVARLENGFQVYEATDRADVAVDDFSFGRMFLPPETRRAMIELAIAEAGLSSKVEVAFLRGIYDRKGFPGVVAEIACRHPGVRLHGLHGADIGGMAVQQQPTSASDRPVVAIKLASKSDELLQSFALRFACFIGELDVPYSEEFDGQTSAPRTSWPTSATSRRCATGVPVQVLRRARAAGGDPAFPWPRQRPAPARAGRGRRWGQAHRRPGEAGRPIQAAHRN